MCVCVCVCVCVCERERERESHWLVAQNQSTISQHLALLRKDGFVQARREGQTQYYSLTGDEARSILETLLRLRGITLRSNRLDWRMHCGLVNGWANR